MPDYSPDYARGLADGRADAAADLAQWVRQAEDNSGEAQRRALQVEQLIQAMTDAAERLETASRQVALPSAERGEIR